MPVGGAGFEHNHPPGIGEREPPRDGERHPAGRRTAPADGGGHAFPYPWRASGLVEKLSADGGGAVSGLSCRNAGADAPSGGKGNGRAALFSTFGGTHIITCLPYDRRSWKAYDRDGRPVELEVVDL